jgi:hypothetical protein
VSASSSMKAAMLSLIKRAILPIMPNARVRCSRTRRDPASGTIRERQRHSLVPMAFAGRDRLPVIRARLTMTIQSA